jgi:competence protein ComGC
MSSLKLKSGYSLVEMVIYVAIISVISIVIVNMLLSFSQSYRNLTVLRLIEHSGTDSFERMVRDISAANSVDTGNSIFNSNPGVLTLVASYGGNSTTTKFYVQNGILKVDVNGSYFGPLTVSNTSISNLVFTLLDSGISNAIKIDMTLVATSGPVTKTKTYHSTILLKD